MEVINPRFLNFAGTTILMKELIKRLNELKKGDVSTIVDKRLKEFSRLRSSTSDRLFHELCFCILTANFNAERCVKIQDSIRNGFSEMSLKDLQKELAKHGHRYPNKRAEYIVEARKHKPTLRNIQGDDVRGWLVKNVKGLGMKEASHFLRNIGYTDFAIIDFHIIDLLNRYKIIKRPKTLTEKRYLEIEEVLRKIAERAGMNLAELDLYLWYMETGKILK